MTSYYVKGTTGTIKLEANKPLSFKIEKKIDSGIQSYEFAGTLDDITLFSTIKVLKEFYPDFIIEKDEQRQSEKDIEFKNKVIFKIKNRLNIGDDFIEILAKFGAAYPDYVFSLFLKEASILLDRKYKDHIKDCEYIYIYSYNNLAPMKLASKSINRWTNFAAFRNEEDCMYAVNLFKDLLK